MSEQLVQGIVRILDSNRDTVGTGFVILESGLIATCSHVIQDEVLQKRGTPRPEKATIIFHATGDEQDARIEPQWWLPWDGGDLAIIRAEGILPQGVQPLPLGSAEGTNGHEVCTFGFPDVNDIEGLGADGKVVRILLNSGKSMLQLRSSEITAGFSGAPIWDKLGRRVIGMVSAITEPDRHHRLAETAFAISTETLRNVCSLLHLSDVCPYRGLAAFTEVDTEFFFGRQQIVDSLLNRLRRDPRFLTVLGPSGSGKSSVVQAGLIPQLRSGKISGSNCWGIIVTRPATQPFDELRKQGLVDESHDLTESVRVWMSQHTEQDRLVLVIDQFEELLSICPEAIRQDFITQLVKLLHSPLPITVVLVMRDDFYSRLTQQAALVEWLERSRGPVHVPKLLKKDELIAIIQKPAEAVGLRCEEGLVGTIVKDTIETAVESEDGGQAGRSATLPLLEFALTELWERRREGMLTHEAYHSIGRVAGALTQWADRAFYALKHSERQLAQRILTDLVYVGDENQGILDSRRRRTLISLHRNESEQESFQRVVQHLVEHRLLTTDRNLQSNEETVEIIHDVLLREWEHLKEWLEKDRRFLTWHQDIERLARGWIIQRDKNKLLKGRDLTEAEKWLKERGSNLNQDEIALLRASATHRIRFVANIIAIVLLLVSTTGVAGWYYLHQPPDPTHVTVLQDSVVGSLRWAINNAPSGSTITFDERLRGQTVLLNADLLIPPKHLGIRGPDRGSIIISSKTNGLIVPAKASVSIFNLTFIGGPSNISPLVKNTGTLTFINSTIQDNKTGGGIYNDSGSVILMNCTISGNTANNGGGIYNTGRGHISIKNSTISGNRAKGGGGIENISGSVNITNSVISGNTANDAGAATIASGGGIDNLANLSIVNSTISGNTTDYHGGGIDNFGGNATITNSVISGNRAATGGGIFSGPDFLLYTNNANYTANYATCVGSVTVIHFTYSGKTDNYIACISSVIITNSTIANNIDTYGYGGGIWNADGNATLMNSTISDNTASPGNGGGIYNYGGTIRVVFCTIYSNYAYEGGGIFTENDPEFQNHFHASFVLSNSLVAGNHASTLTNPDIGGTVISDGFNLFQNTSGTVFLDPNHKHNSDLSGYQLADLKIDPKLSGTNGSAMVHALLAGSPAIDQIPLNACNVKDEISPTDQRGMKRPDGKEHFCDIGAYEYVDIQ